MDNGLDIDERRCVLAFHAAAVNSHANLVRFPRTFVQLRTQDASIETTQNALSAVSQSLNYELQWDCASRSLEWATRIDHHIVTIFDRNYPTLLREVVKPTIVLFVRGNLDALRGDQIAVFGSRKPSHSVKEIAFRVARALSREAYAITSGLANGIDAAAHRGAIDSGGMTVGLFGCGIDRVYPARNRGLASRVAGSGALMSEFPLGSAPLPYHFPRRN